MTETHPEERFISYARVNSTGRRLTAGLSGFATPDAASGTSTARRRPADRRALNQMLGKPGPGDVVTVTRIDRLARSTFELLGIVKRIVDTKAQFWSPAELWADTGTSTGRLMLAVLGGLAGRRARLYPHPEQGRRRAGQRKAHGPPPLPETPAQQNEATRHRAQNATLQELADSYDRSISTMRRATRAA